VQVEPIKPTSKAPGIKRLTLRDDALLSISAFRFNSRCYILAMFRVLVTERNSHLIVLIAYRIAQLALGFYSFYYPMALFAPVLDYVLLFEGWTAGAYTRPRFSST